MVVNAKSVREVFQSFLLCRSRRDEAPEEILDMLFTFTDFLLFKQMFLDYKAVSFPGQLDIREGDLGKQVGDVGISYWEDVGVSKSRLGLLEPLHFHQQLANMSMLCTQEKEGHTTDMGLLVVNSMKKPAPAH